MTRNKKALRLSSILSSISPSSMTLEMKKTSRGAVMVISDVMSVGEYTDETIELLSHSGRMNIAGESLRISVLEGRVIEIYGRITEARMSYGKT